MISCVLTEFLSYGENAIFLQQTTQNPEYYSTGQTLTENESVMVRILDFFNDILYLRCKPNT